MRLNYLRTALAAILAASLAVLCGYAAPRPTPQPKVELTVSAAISLKDALNEIAQLYYAENPGAVIHFNLGVSGTLQHQIEQGAPVDVFISASEDQMNALESEGLLSPGTRKDLLKNTVVLIVPKGKSGISSFQDLARPEVKVIAIGDPQTVPAGKYAQQVLTHFHLYEQLKPKLVLAKDVRQVLTYVITGNVDAGIVYATDAKISTAVVVVAIAPEDSHSPTVYPVAALKGSKQPAEAKRFLDFLMSAKALGVFKNYGFKPAGE
ncbi:MAG: molybdate ABC transporter substrate-binding protein [Candidatus Acidiferrales bacterium]